MLIELRFSANFEFLLSKMKSLETIIVFVSDSFEFAKTLNSNVPTALESIIKGIS